MVNEEIKAALDRGVPAERKMTILGGVSGSGKSSARRTAGLTDDKYVTIDPDEFKQRLIGGGYVETMPGLTPFESAHLVHEESSVLADMLMREATKRGLNIVVDSTMRTPDGALARMALAKDQGYSIDGLFVDISVGKARASSKQRWRGGVERFAAGQGIGGRPVPGHVLDGFAPKNPEQFRSSSAEVFHTFASEGWFDSATWIDNEDGFTLADPDKPGDYPGDVVWTAQRKAAG